MTSPLNFFYTNKTTENYMKTLTDFKEGTLEEKDKPTDSQLWKYHYVVKSNIHSGFKKPVNKFFRLSSFVYVNMPILWGFTIAAPTTTNVIFW